MEMLKRVMLTVFSKEKLIYWISAAIISITAAATQIDPVKVKSAVCDTK